jgi:antitoxin HicB
MNKNRHIGSGFEAFLEEEGLLADATLSATMKVLAAQIAAEMKRKGLTKSAMAASMQTTRAQLDRLLDPDNDSVTLSTLKQAAKALAKTLKLELA